MRLALVAMLAALALAGCGASDSGTGGGQPPEGQGSSAQRRADAARAAEAAGRTRPDSVQRSHCPPEVAGCAVTEGRIAYVEAVDPDGDGDAHFVIVDGQSITLPGLTAIDVRKGLRPHPLPGPGDLVSAAGPVQTGSYGQDQIHALEFHVAGE